MGVGDAVALITSVVQLHPCRYRTNEAEIGQTMCGGYPLIVPPRIAVAPAIHRHLPDPARAVRNRTWDLFDGGEDVSLDTLDFEVLHPIPFLPS